MSMLIVKFKFNEQLKTKPTPTTHVNTQIHTQIILYNHTHFTYLDEKNIHGRRFFFKLGLDIKSELIR